MGLFDSRAVKELKNSAGAIGQIVAEEAYGLKSTELAQDMLASDHFSGRLRRGFDAAAAEIGAEKAREKASREAESWARMAADVMKVPSGAAPQQASATVQQLLA